MIGASDRAVKDLPSEIVQTLVGTQPELATFTLVSDPRPPVHTVGELPLKIIVVCHL